MATDVLVEKLEEQLQEAKKMSKVKQLKKRLVSIAVVIALILGAFGAAWFSGSSHAKEKYVDRIEKLNEQIEDLNKRIKELIDNENVVNPVTPQIVLDTVNSEIQDIGELATIEYDFTNSARFSDSVSIGKWNLPFTEKSFIAKWDGRIKAGIILEKVTAELDENEKRIVICIPAAEILSYETFYDTVEMLDERDGMFNKLKIEDKVSFDAATAEDMQNRAIENGILEKAQKNAETIITKILMANPLIADNYSVEFVVITE